MVAREDIMVCALVNKWSLGENWFCDDGERKVVVGEEVDKGEVVLRCIAYQTLYCLLKSYWTHLVTLARGEGRWCMRAISMYVIAGMVSFPEKADSDHRMDSGLLGRGHDLNGKAR